MKKIIPYCYLAILLYCFIKFLFPSPVFAAPCPPLGTNIAANFDRENLEWIANHANCDGPIPITVIITPAMVQNPNILIDIQNNLGELNFNPTWRPWGFVDPDNTQELNAWIDTFSLLEIGQLQAWNEWNRYKEAGTLDPVRDARVVQALINARNQGLINIPIGNTPLDLLNYTDMNYRDYWRKFNQACPGCINQLDFIVSNVYAPSQYGPNSVNEFLNVWLGELNFLRSLGVNLDNKFFIISEAGLAPGAYANFEERLRDTLLFAQALEAAILADPNLFPGLDQITFLLMNDDTGVIYLIYRECDDQGICVWKVREYLEYNFNVPGSPFSSFSSLLCEPQSTGDRDSRPDACDPCNKTSYLTQSCATSFTVNDTVKYERREGAKEEPHCVEPDWSGTVIIDASNTTIPFVGKKWVEGDINSREDEQKYLADYFEGTDEYYQTYDIQVGIPFFGGKTAFHGTNTTLLPNYQGVFRKLTPMEYQDQLKVEMVKRAQKTVDSGGELEPGGIHNYNVAYKPRLCWDLPFFGEAAIEFARRIAGEMELKFGPVETNTSDLFSFMASISHYCLYNFGGDDKKLDLALGAIDSFNNTMDLIGPLGNLFKIQTEGKIDGVEKPLTDLAGNFPPDPSEEDYVKKWQEWKDSEWGRLWEAVPMFSRDDTPGEIEPYYGIKSKDQPQYIPIQIEKVPHLARLFEETLGLNELLLPEGTAGAPKFVQNQEETSLASAENDVLSQETKAGSCSSSTTTTIETQVLGEKTILAQGDEDTVPATASIVLVQQGCVVKPFIQVNMCPAGTRENGVPYHATIRCGSPWDDVATNIFGQVGPGVWLGDYSCSGVDLSNMAVGQSITLSVFATKIDAQHCLPIENINLTCTVTKNGPECGQYEATCATGPPLEELCGIAGPMPVSDCNRDAIKDTNPNDKICGEPKECDKYQAINFEFTAFDAFQNHLYLECGTTGEYSCNWVEVTPGVNELVCQDHCYDEITQEVNRRFGINLVHPYLNEIWNLSTNSETFGIFNIFRPAEIPQFEDLDASSEINYTYIDTSLPSGGSVTPGTGEFYFNHLGGVQKAKEWVTTKVLMPYVEQ